MGDSCATLTAHGCAGTSGNVQVISWIKISVRLRESGLTLPESLVRLRRPDSAARRDGVGVGYASGAEPARHSSQTISTAAFARLHRLQSTDTEMQKLESGIRCI